jgi:hypothetical protein
VARISLNEVRAARAGGQGFWYRPMQSVYSAKHGGSFD